MPYDLVDVLRGLRNFKVRSPTFRLKDAMMPESNQDAQNHPSNEEIRRLKASTSTYMTNTEARVGFGCSRPNEHDSDQNSTPDLTSKLQEPLPFYCVASNKSLSFKTNLKVFRSVERQDGLDASSHLCEGNRFKLVQTSSRPNLDEEDLDSLNARLEPVQTLGK